MGQNEQKSPNGQRVRSVKDEGMATMGMAGDLAVSGGFRAQHLHWGEEKEHLPAQIPFRIPRVPADPC